MKIINKILCNTVHAICATADFIGVVVGTVIKWAILFAFGIAAVAAALFVWFSVPTAFLYAICGDGPMSQTQVFAYLGFFAAWTILLKIAYDRWDRCINNSRLDKFFEEFNKRA